MVDFIKKYWWALVALLGSIFFYEKLENTETQLEIEKFKNQDGKLENQQENLKTSLDKQKQDLVQMEATHDQAIKNNSGQATPQQVEDYWKKRNDS